MSKTKSPFAAHSSSKNLPVTVAVLAAGLSRRMGGPNKLLQPLDGKPMVRHVVEHALASQSNRVLVVVGHQGEKLRAALDDLPVEFVANHLYEEGLAASVRACAAAVRPTDALMVCLGDMPKVTPTILDRLIEVYRYRPDFLAWQPVYAGRRGNPVLWAPVAISELATLSGDEGARTLLRTHQQSVQLVSVDTDGILLDVDTPEALTELQQEKVLRT